MAPSEDTTLTEKCPHGEADAFEVLVRDHQRMIHALCYRMTGSMADAEDLAQETFLHAYRNAASFRREAKVSSWLYRIAVNLCLNWQKLQQRRERLLRAWSNEIPESFRPGDETNAQPIQAALLKLPLKQRAAIVLTVYDGLDHAEAARALGCSETTVSWRLFAARRKLKSLLKGLPAKGGPHE